MTAAKRIIHVTPESFQDDISELRSEIANLFTNEGAEPPEHSPIGVVVGFLADHGKWNPQSLVGQQGSVFVRVFQEWSKTNRPLTDSEFQLHLRKFLHATALSYSFNPDTSSIAAVHGVRVSHAANSVYYRSRFLDILSRLTVDFSRGYWS